MVKIVASTKQPILVYLSSAGVQLILQVNLGENRLDSLLSGSESIGQIKLLMVSAMWALFIP